MMVLPRILATALVAGWLADRLAHTDPDVEAGIAAFEDGQHDQALEHFAAATQRLGERPEISLDRGLALLAKGDKEGAQAAFERASEADDANLRASAWYELGNLAFDAEQWDLAIAHYIDCLKARPDHSNAKWNLELALRRKQGDEDDKDDEDDGTSTGEGGSDTGGSDDSGSDTGGSDESGSEGSGTGGGESGGSDEGGSGTGGDGSGQEPQGSTGKSPDEDDNKDSDQGGSGGEQPPKPEQNQPAAQENFDVDRALEQLDEQDRFPLGRPRGGFVAPKKDW